MHQPDPTVPIDETLGALRELVDAGTVREIGCSNFSDQQIRDAALAAERVGVRFVSVQNEYSLFHRDPERGVLDACIGAGLAFLPYYPLASGLLTGKYRRGREAPPGTRLSGGRYAELLSPEHLDVVERLTAFAIARGRTLLELAVSWLLARSVVASVRMWPASSPARPAPSRSARTPPPPAGVSPPTSCARSTRSRPHRPEAAPRRHRASADAVCCPRHARSSLLRSDYRWALRPPSAAECRAPSRRLFGHAS